FEPLGLTARDARGPADDDGAVHGAPLDGGVVAASSWATRDPGSLMLRACSDDHRCARGRTTASAARCGAWVQPERASRFTGGVVRLAVKVNDAGVRSRLPAASIARTLNVCLTPAVDARTASRTGAEQGLKMPRSSLHWKCEGSSAV